MTYFVHPAGLSFWVVRVKGHPPIARCWTRRSANKIAAALNAGRS